MKYTDIASNVKDRFLRYAQVDTQSDPSMVETHQPSTQIQMDLINLLASELKSLGIKDIKIDPKGVLVAHLPANVENVPCIGFMAHVDTAPGVQGNGVKPQVTENYDGEDIVLGTSGNILVASENPELEQYKGGTIITSDGTTLLGADDKAGVSEIMTMVHFLTEDDTIKHGEIEIIFTCDEETGSGMDSFPYDMIHCDYCYTVDGGTRYEIESECFNASTVFIDIVGKSYHTGSARGRLINALTIASKMISALPQAESPEATDGRYGFYCPLEVKGNLEKASLEIFIRDFDLKELERREEVLKQQAKMLEALYPGSVVNAKVKRQYYNMVEVSKKIPKVLDSVFEAGKRLGQPLFDSLIRGGTDGARLANEQNIPCPNLYTGGHNYHSLYEWAALDAMEDAIKLLIEIVKIGAEK